MTLHQRGSVKGITEMTQQQKDTEMGEVAWPDRKSDRERASFSLFTVILSRELHWVPTRTTFTSLRTCDS